MCSEDSVKFWNMSKLNGRQRYLEEGREIETKVSGGTKIGTPDEINKIPSHGSVVRVSNTSDIHGEKRISE
jgi:hypothetical protein